jgi:hypothetical protein
VTYRQNGLRRCASTVLLAAIAAAATTFPPGLASAQGFFDSFFGRSAAEPSAPAYSNPFADFNPFRARPETPRPQIGGSVVYCVRTCDGRYFPIQRVAGANPAQLCSAFCPATATMIYSGGSIEHAVGTDGKRYSELSTAFIYREKVVPGCSCNGKDAFGLVPLNAEDDATLRAGDIIATRSGFLAYSGVGRGRTAQFTPIDAQRGLSEEMRQKLAETKVESIDVTAVPAETDAGTQGEGTPPAAARGSRNKRVQAR